MLNNVDSTSVDINTNGKDKTIPPDYCYTLSASIAILSTVKNTYSQFLQCLQVRGAFGSSPYTPSISPMLRMYEKYLGWKLYHSTCFVLWFELAKYHSQSPSDPSAFVPRMFLQSEDCQPEQQSAYHDYH